MIPKLKITKIESVSDNETRITGINIFGKPVSEVLPAARNRIEQYFIGDKLIQHALPELNDSQREFLITGLSDEEWDEMFDEE